jgi:hypothetical protein
MSKLGMVLVGVAYLAGCAEVPGDIDRTQPNKVAKKMFEGEWYFRQTVVDANSTAYTAFQGLEGQMEKIKFEFTEDSLIGRRTHEDVIGISTSQQGVPSFTPEYGQPVVSFRVSQWFDVQRDYNASTGERTNTISENGSDRPWYEREYLRVDWTNNQIASESDPFPSIEMMGDVAVTPQDSGKEVTFRTECADKDNKKVECSPENNDIVYFDVVTTYVSASPWIECITDFGYPNNGADCGPETVEVRSSFRKVDKTDDYIARQYDEYDMLKFGFFRTERCVYDRFYGCRDSSKVLLANNWKIFQNYRNTDGSVKPVAERTTKPIAYYLNTEMPVPLIDDTFEATEQWSAVFARAVAAAQGKTPEQVGRMFYLCFNPGFDNIAAFQPTLDGWKAESKDPVATALLQQAAEASAEGYAKGICKQTGTEKLIGDLRYSYINWVNNQTTLPWGGYGPSASDPLTAQIVSGNANLNGSNYDEAANRVYELLQILLGELEPEDVGFAKPTKEYFANLREQFPADAYFGNLKSAGQAKYFNFLKGQINKNIKNLERAKRTNLEVLNRPRVKTILKQKPEFFRAKSAMQSEPLEMFRGSSVEQRAKLAEFKQLSRPADIAQAAGKTLTPAEQAEINSFDSPIDFGTLKAVSRRMGERQRQYGMKSFCFMDGAWDSDMVGFAYQLAKFRAELLTSYPALADDKEALRVELWQWVRGKMERATLEHELGHTVGLRHQFRASADAMNYFPQYWALRHETFNEDCDNAGYKTFKVDGFATGDVAPATCGGSEADRLAQSPALLQQIREGRLSDGTQFGNSITEYQYSSTMEYARKPNSDISGLGMYDYAAIAFSYVNMVEVFNEAPSKLKVRAVFDPVTGNFSSSTVSRSPNKVKTMLDVDDYTYTAAGATDTDPEGDQIRDNQWTYWHYSTLPVMFYKADAAPIDPTSNVAFAYAPQIKEGLSHLKGMTPMFDRRMKFADQVGAGEVKVPYGFCSDEYNGSASDCRIFDSGADEYENFVNLKEQYASRYVYSMFRRDRPGFAISIYPVFSGAMSTYFTPALNAYQFWLLKASNRGVEWYNTEHGGQMASIAAQEAINFIAEAITVPSPGTYATDNVTGQLVNLSYEYDYRLPSTSEAAQKGYYGDDYTNVTLSDGARYSFAQYKENADGQIGYYDAYFGLGTEIMSHFWYKYAAMIALMSGDVEVVGTDTASNQSGFVIPPYIVFADDLTKFMGGVITENFDDVGRCVTRNADGTIAVDPIPAIRGTGPSCAAGQQVLNPYADIYNRSDFNMRTLGTIYPTAYFQSTYSSRWLDSAAIYIVSRDTTGDLPAGFQWFTYTSDLGIQYATKIPTGFDPTDRASDKIRIGYDMLAKMNTLQIEKDSLTAIQTLLADLPASASTTDFETLYNDITVAGASGASLASVVRDPEFQSIVRLELLDRSAVNRLNTLVPSLIDSIVFDLQSQEEDVRYLADSVRMMQGLNVYMPGIDF